MIETTVETVQTGGARTVTPGTPVSEAAEQLRDPEVSALTVVEDGSVVGVVTESDIVALVAETDARPTVEAILSTPARTVSPAATVHEAAERMRTEGVKHLPVVGDGAVCGLLSAETLAPYLSRHNVDVAWHGDRLQVESSEPSGVTAGD